MGEIDYYLMGLGCLFIGAGFFFLLDKPKRLPLPNSKFIKGDKVAAYRGVTGRTTGIVSAVCCIKNGYEYYLERDQTVYHEKQLRKLVRKTK